jgi:hypothetical protein
MPASAAPSSSGLSAADNVARLKGRLMALSLGQLLDQARGARDVLPHLAALERSLLEAGIAAIDQVPGQWLHRICTQLSSLPLPEHDPPLHDLLERLMQRLQALHEPPARTRLDEFDPERTVVVREITHSEFMAEENAQATTQPMPRL